MKTLTFALMLLTTGIMQAQNSAQSTSFSIKEKVHQFIVDISAETAPDSNSLYQLSLFPNPVTSHLHVNSTGLIKKITLVNTKGKAVKRVRLKGVKSYTFDTSSLKKGYYRVIISHGNQVSSELFKNE